MKLPHLVAPTRNLHVTEYAWPARRAWTMGYGGKSRLRKVPTWLGTGLEPREAGAGTATIAITTAVDKAHRGHIIQHLTPSFSSYTTSLLILLSTPLPSTLIMVSISFITDRVSCARHLSRAALAEPPRRAPMALPPHPPLPPHV